MPFSDEYFKADPKGAKEGLKRCESKVKAHLSAVEQAKKQKLVTNIKPPFTVR